MIQVVDRTFDILEMLARDNVPMSNSEIAARMNLGIQTVNNLLRTLYARGYVTQDESRNYLLGAQCFYLGSFADRWKTVRQMVAEPLKQLVRASSFSGFVGVLDNDRLLGIALLSPGETNLIHPRQDWWNELHSTATGRVLLAALSPSERARIFARTTRRKYTGKTIIDAKELERICAKTARDGYAEVKDESRAGVSSLAVPLHDISGKVFAALALHATDNAWKRVSLEAKLTHLMNTVKRLETR